jgi:hypothetical protein
LLPPLEQRPVELLAPFPVDPRPHSAHPTGHLLTLPVKLPPWPLGPLLLILRTSFGKKLRKKRFWVKICPNFKI